MPNIKEISLDALDRKLLFELDRDSRLTFAELSRKVRCSLQTSRNRVQRLVSRGVIQKFHCAIDTSRLGLQMYEMYLKLRTSDEGVRSAIVEHLAAESWVTWIARSDGAFDIVSALRVRTPTDLAGIVDRLMSVHGLSIARKAIQLNVSMEYLPRSYLVKRPRQGRHLKHLDEFSEKVEIDSLDGEILYQLGQDARLGATDISRALINRGVTLSREAVMARVKRMEAQGPINGATIVINHQRIGRQHYKLLIQVDLSKQAALKKALESCRAEPRVVYLVRTLGDWDYELDLEVESTEQLREIVARVLGAHPPLVKDYAVVELLQIIKYSVTESILKISNRAL